AALPATAIHSISIGALRFPRQMFATLTELYPRERLFASGLQQGDTMVSYPSHIEREMVSFCRIELSRYVPRSILFTCHPGMP
ncbi:MAG: DNA photolyase, partial [Acidobacteriota bacterium]